ncbi:MAG: riboflavin synthase [Deltaproteobacteria bacterium]|nr:riboflavin synthase [Deltaproteobacteria bacterium]
MFTGLIQCVGKVNLFTPRGSEATLSIASGYTTFEHGESIAINGTCLSVSSFKGNTFTVFASAETLRISGIGRLRPGASVNLEKALTLSTPLGGHLVTGHVDTRVRLLERIGETEAARFRFELPESGTLRHQIASKGSVAIDGVSLTVNQVTDTFFEVMIIPVTLQHTTLQTLEVGMPVNLETDILAKYVSRRLEGGDTSHRNDGISMEMLMQNGFMR